MQPQKTTATTPKGKPTSERIKARIQELIVVIGRFERDSTVEIDESMLAEYRQALAERDILRARLAVVLADEQAAAAAARKPARDAARVAAALATREVVFADFIAEAAEHLAKVLELAEQADALAAELKRRNAEALRICREAGVAYTATPASELQQWVREEIRKRHVRACAERNLSQAQRDYLPSGFGWGKP